MAMNTRSKPLTEISNSGVAAGPSPQGRRASRGWVALICMVILAASAIPSWSAPSPFDRALSLSPGCELHVRHMEPFRFSLSLGRRQVLPPWGKDWPEQGRVVAASFTRLRINRQPYALVILRMEHDAVVFSMASLACLIDMTSGRCPLTFTAWVGQDAGYEEIFEYRALIVMPGPKGYGDELLVPSLIVPERTQLRPPEEIARHGFAQPLKAGFARYRMEPGGRCVRIAARELVLLDGRGRPGNLAPTTEWKRILATSARSVRGQDRQHVREEIQHYEADLREDPNWSASAKAELGRALVFLLTHLSEKKLPGR